MKESDSIAFIFARGGSKGIPRKNIVPLVDKPLISYTIETALQCPSISRVIVSTDNEEIAEVAKQYGAEIPFLRPKKFALDRSCEWEAWQHAISFVQNQINDNMKIFVSLPTTSPLRSVEDVEKCIEVFKKKDVDIVITAKHAERNPYFNMVKVDDNDFCHLVCEGDKAIYNRQEAPSIYDITTVAYVANPNFILNAKNMFEGRVCSVLIPPERAIDIDNNLDLKIAEMLLRERDDNS